MPDYVTLQIGHYEVQIRATVPGGAEDNESGYWTKAFLNEMAIAFHESSELNFNRGLRAIAGRGARYNDDIYGYLQNEGYYDE